MDIRFRAGEAQHFIATRPFALANTGINVSKGQEVYFDGTKANVDGSEYVCPQLRGAVKADWLILAEDYDENMSVGRVSANINVRHATQAGAGRQSMATSVSEEERVMGNTKAHAKQTHTANAGYVRGQTAVNPNGVVSGQPVKTQRGMMTVEPQDGHVVERAPLKTAAGAKAKEMRVSADAASIIESQISKVQIEPVAGVTRDELIERMEPQEREEYLARIAANKAQYVDEAPTVTKVDAAAPKVINRVEGKKHGEAEGMRFSNSTGGGTEIFDPTGLGSGKATESSFEQEGIRFRSVNGPKRDLQSSQHPRSEAAPQPVAVSAGQPKPSVKLSPEVRLSIAKSVCADFPANYDFAAPPKKKLARIMADFEDRPDFLRAIYTAEDEVFRETLVAEFPTAFSD